MLKGPANHSQELFTLKGHSRRVQAVALSTDGATIVSGSHDGTVRVWDVQTQGEKLTLTGHTGRIMSVAFSLDGTRLASAGWEDRTVKVWDMATSQVIHSIQGHTSAVMRVRVFNERPTHSSIERTS